MCKIAWFCGIFQYLFDLPRKNRELSCFPQHFSLWRRFVWNLLIPIFQEVSGFLTLFSKKNTLLTCVLLIWRLVFHRLLIFYPSFQRHVLPHQEEDKWDLCLTMNSHQINLRFRGNNINISSINSEMLISRLESAQQEFSSVLLLFLGFASSFCKFCSVGNFEERIPTATNASASSRNVSICKRITHLHNRFCVVLFWRSSSCRREKYFCSEIDGQWRGTEEACKWAFVLH